MAEFRILSLDGGGSWALIQVKTLIDLYSKTGDGSDISGHELLRKFDLIVANSAGALVLGGLIKNLSLKETLDYFIDAEKRERLFVEYSLWQKLQISFLHVIGIGPNYITEAKFSGLETILGDAGAQLVTKVPAAIGAGDRGQLPHILICAFDYDVKRGVFFRSDEKSLAASFALMSTLRSHKPFTPRPTHRCHSSQRPPRDQEADNTGMEQSEATTTRCWPE
jgi:hypothetical protein